MSYRSGRICLGMACVATLRLETREPCRTGNVVDEDETCVEHGERSVTGCSEKVGDVKNPLPHHTDHSEKPIERFVHAL
jgi:hypothetical protein